MTESLLQEIAKLRGELNDANAMIAFLKEKRRTQIVPIDFQTSAMQTEIINFLLQSRGLCDRYKIFEKLYGRYPDSTKHLRVIDVHMNHVRGRLRKYGVEIQNERGSGWIIDAKNRMIIHKVIGET